MKWLAIAPLKRSLLPVALAVVLLTGSAAHAYRAIGAGTDLCETWTADRRQPLGSGSLQDEQWVLGFLSGIGYEGEEVIDPLVGLDAQAVWAWVDDYCQAHPLEKIAAAAEAFSYEHPRWPARGWDRGCEKAAKRTVDAVCDAMGRTLDTVTSDECRNYFAHAGYEPT